MKKEIMLIFVFMVLAMTGCSQTTDSLLIIKKYIKSTKMVIPMVEKKIIYLSVMEMESIH